MTPEEDLRYQRNTALAQVGVEGQERLLAARVLVIGAGGLGSAVLPSLAAAGIGTIAIMDGDTIEASNLNRQTLHTPERIGMGKAESAVRTLTAFNPGITIEPMAERFTQENATSILKDEGWGLVFDCTDNFETRFLIADICRRQDQVLVSASVQGFGGQLFVQGTQPDDPCYRCMIPGPPPPGSVPTPAETGVLGAVVATLGSMQATEGIKVLLGIGKPLTRRLLTYDAIQPRCRILERHQAPTCPLCRHPQTTN
ncbi:MAG: HesA/MoeB/ThiF family protein [Planctomycetota bacterium]|jgi:adenylyltransferase/sulfurtransferase